MPDQILGMHSTDWLVVGGYCGLLLLIGFASAFRIQTMADYFTGGRRFGGGLSTFFAFGTGTSGDQSGAGNVVAET